jgi:hypothetical protein
MRGSMMLRLMQLRFAAVVLFAATLVSLSAASAWAFTQEYVLPGWDGKSMLVAPDKQGTDSSQGARPFGLSGPVVQFGVQQGPLTPFGRFQGSGFNASPSNSAPDYYSRPLGNGN